MVQDQYWRFILGSASLIEVQSMASKKLPVVWCRPLIGCQRYDVLITDTASTDHLAEEEEAATLWETTEVAIQNALSAERKEDCFAHEVFGHALLEASGLDRAFQRFLGLTKKQWDEFEEECLVRQYIPSLLALLKANGWLQLPPIPRTPSKPATTSTAKRRRSRRRKT